MLNIIPNKQLKSHNGFISSLFIDNSVFDFHSAISFIHSCPYGRVDSPLSIIQYGIGTCSTKHALIKSLADEIKVPIQLKLGLFMMSSSDEPKIEHILTEYGLTNVPEAHCYLSYNNVNIDITFPENQSFNMRYQIFDELIISTEDISGFKQEWHREKLESYVRENHVDYSGEELWKIREECIAALSSSPDSQMPSRCMYVTPEPSSQPV